MKFLIDDVCEFYMMMILGICKVEFKLKFVLDMDNWSCMLIIVELETLVVKFDENGRLVFDDVYCGLLS